MTTSFCRWYPLEDAAQCAPEQPGVLQLRVRVGLIGYPSGRSAMVHYEAATDVRTSALALARHLNGHDLLCRHAVEGEFAHDPDSALETLLQRFVRRFGEAPRCPEVTHETR